jgi:hypothetical protein
MLFLLVLLIVLLFGFACGYGVREWISRRRQRRYRQRRHQSSQSDRRRRHDGDDDVTNALAAKIIRSKKW